jgi:2-methylcitrate dehydratase
MVYIIASLLRKAFNKYDRVMESKGDLDEMWKALMLTPLDYSHAAIFNDVTR